LLDWIVQITTRLGSYNPLEVLVELALIGTVVYLVFRFLRGTRGARVLKGGVFIVIIAMALVAGLGTDNPGFERLRFLLDKFLIFAAFALAIVFQPELRRALVRIGEARFFRGGSAQLQSVTGEITRAVEYLSKNKIGAIIAIERLVGLKGIVEGGTAVGARVSADLLKTIFWPGSALHDMGVVIRDGEVAAAGVQFPLAEGHDLSQDIGSRHRAAVGLSMEADCLLVVVSEETGAISLAERGQLLRKLSVEGLQAMLLRGLSQGEPDKDAAPGRPGDKPRKKTSPRPAEQKPSGSDKSAA